MVTYYEKGKSVRISVTFKDNSGTAIDPTDPSIKIERRDGTSLVASTSLTKDSVGNYHYIWDTTEDLQNDDYYITTNGTYSGHNLLERVRVKLVTINEN